MFYIGDLFQWERFITPSIIKLFYWLVVVIVILGGLSGLVSALGILTFNPIAARIDGARELRRHAGRHPVRPHRGGIHPDGVPHQRAPRGDPQSRRDVVRIAPPLVPAKAGGPQGSGKDWMPACAGMSG